jgi:hypothetical protein
MGMTEVENGKIILFSIHLSKSMKDKVVSKSLDRNATAWKNYNLKKFISKHHFGKEFNIVIIYLIW